MISIFAVIIFSLCVGSQARAMQDAQNQETEQRTEDCLVIMPNENELEQWFVKNENRLKYDEDALKKFLAQTNFIKIIAGKKMYPVDIIGHAKVCLDAYLVSLQDVSHHDCEELVIPEQEVVKKYIEERKINIAQIMHNQMVRRILEKISHFLANHPQAQKEFNNLANKYWLSF